MVKYLAIGLVVGLGIYVLYYWPSKLYDGFHSLLPAYFREGEEPDGRKKGKGFYELLLGPYYVPPDSPYHKEIADEKAARRVNSL